jgi:UDP-N-acetylglucosamine:LPS N-acetylglucosamine transferase
MQKVLILTAGFGEGHNAAARNLREALELASDDVQVEVLDLLESADGRLNTLVKNTYLKVLDHAPFVWNGIYGWLNSTTWPHPDGQVGLARLRQHLADVLRTTEPDCVVTTYPIYAPLIQQLFRDHQERPFRLISVVTDSITANALWWRAPSDLWIVSNEATAAVLRAGGVPADKVKALGVPVSPRFAELTGSGYTAATRKAGDGDYRVVKNFDDTQDETLFVVWGMMVAGDYEGLARLVHDPTGAWDKKALPGVLRARLRHTIW